MLSCTDRLAIAWQDFLILCGRPLFGWIFMQSGWRKLMDMPAFIKTSLIDREVPFPNFLGYIAAPVESATATGNLPARTIARSTRDSGRTSR